MGAELLLSSLVVFYGCYTSLIHGVWNCFSGNCFALSQLFAPLEFAVVVLLCHSYFNVFRRSEESIISFKARREAIQKFKSLTRVNSEILRSLNETCVICCSEMKSGVLRTPCNHIFHNSCVKKWICVKATCPLCNKDLEQPSPDSESQSTSRRESQAN